MDLIKLIFGVLIILTFGIIFLLGVSYLFTAGIIFASSSDKVFTGERNQLYDNGDKRGSYEIYNSNTQTMANFFIWLNEFKGVFIVFLMASFLFILFLANKTGLLMKLKEVMTK